jgi:hypothetical protein
VLQIVSGGARQLIPAAGSLVRVEWEWDRAMVRGKCVESS